MQSTALLLDLPVLFIFFQVLDQNLIEATEENNGRPVSIATQVENLKRDLPIAK